MTKQTTPTSKPEPKDTDVAGISAGDIAALIQQNSELIERIRALETHKEGLDKVIRAPQHVHVGPKQPVTYKTAKGNTRTDR